MSQTKDCYKVVDIPREKHWAILFQESYSTDHGWPGNDHTEYYLKYVAFTDRAEWELEIQALKFTNSPFFAMEVNPAKITAKVTVEV